MDKMGLVTFEKTGHVLGAFTQAVAPAGDVAADQVVGDALLYRHEASGEELAHVEPQHLKVVFVERRDDVLLRSRLYVVKDGLPVECAPPALAANYSPGTLNIDVGTPVTADVKGWVQIEGGAQPIVAQFEIPDTDQDGDLAVTLTAGISYSALVLVPGFGAGATTFTA